MILAGFLGMSSKFVECTLGVKYRRVHADGSVSGGPMWYLQRGLADRGPGLARLGKVCAVVFAVFCIGGSFGGANMFQSNQSYQQVLAVTGGADSWFADKGWLFGLILAFFCRAGDHRRDSINCQGHLEDRAADGRDLRVCRADRDWRSYRPGPGCIRADVLLGAGR